MYTMIVVAAYIEIVVLIFLGGDEIVGMIGG